MVLTVSAATLEALHSGPTRPPTSQRRRLPLNSEHCRSDCRNFAITEHNKHDQCSLIDGLSVLKEAMINATRARILFWRRQPRGRPNSEYSRCHQILLNTIKYYQTLSDTIRHYQVLSGTFRY